MWLRVVLFAIPTIALTAWLHVYLYRHLVKPIRSRALRRTIVALVAVALVVGLFMRLIGPLLGHTIVLGLMLWSGFLLYTFMLILVSHGVARFQPDRRALFERGALVAAAGFTGYGTYRAYTAPELTEIVVALPHLPKALEGFRIVQLTDIHVGPIIQTEFLQDMIARANAQKPDLTVITGDLVDGSVRRLGGFVRELGHLQARYGKCFITGNHDYYAGADEWCAFMEMLGFDVLRNRSVLLPEGLRLIGVDDWSAHRFGDGGYDLQAALKDTHLRDEPSVLLAHQPSGFDEAVAAGVGLQLSGHTHGGQLFPATLGAYAIWQGRSRGLTRVADAHLYVSKGCGFIGPPMRIGSPPEIATIILTAG